MKYQKILLGIAAMLGMTAIFLSDTEPRGPEIPTVQAHRSIEAMETGSEDQTWAIYWYLCGSDLESEFGAATDDLAEMMEVSLPENVKVVIQTGGAAAWKNDYVNADTLGRYVYAGNELELVETQPLANMGASETLEDFLRFCAENYPADRTMALFWNHGGGSVSGAAFDENFEDDSLTLEEFHAAFDAVYPLSQEKPPFEVIGFDTCLMATVDTAYTFQDVGRYLVASEELEPGGGWYYSDWLQKLAEHPEMGGAQLGRHILDAYVEGCEQDWTEGEITLSVTALSELDGLLTAYEAMGREVLQAALKNPSYFCDFSRGVLRAENYGGNTAEQGYTNMVDLGDLIRRNEAILPESGPAVLQALEDCVIYRINGPYRSEATGLSCYFSLNGDTEEFEAYTEIGTSRAINHLINYGLEGTLDEAGMAYVRQLGFLEEKLPEIPTLQTLEQPVYPVVLPSNGYAVLNVGPEAAELLTGVSFRLSYVDRENGWIVDLGQDNDLTMDWENGVFTEHFRGVWGALDGNLVYMEVLFEGDGYTTFSVPIQLNGEAYNLRVIYDERRDNFSILGARRGLGDTGMADKNPVQLQPGDEITTILYAKPLDDADAAWEAIPGTTFRVTEQTAFEELDLQNGMYNMYFELVDSRNDKRCSEQILVEVEDRYIYTAMEE